VSHRARNALIAMFAVAALPAWMSAQDTRSLVRSELLMHFNESIDKVIALAEAMPPERFDWRPEKDAMSVARVYAPIAHYNYGYPQTSLAGPAPAGMRLDTLEAMRDKAQIVALLKNSAAYVRKVVGEMPADRLEASTTLYGRTVPHWAVMLQLVAHMNEHLGQSIAYARSNSIVPPWSR
jgi:uncharacterized damage-inducible protein DinB